MLKATLLGLVVVCAVTVLPGKSEAKSNCTVQQVQYDSGRLFITCANDPVGYYAFSLQQSGCVIQPSDTVKIWVSMFQSQYLSGRPVDFATTATSGSCSIPTIISVLMH